MSIVDRSCDPAAFPAHAKLLAFAAASPFFSLPPSSSSSKRTRLDLLDKLGPLGSGEGLGALDGGTEGAVDDELGKDTDGAGNTEEDGVVVGLGKTVVLEEDTGVGVDVGVGVLGLAVLGKDLGGDLVDLGDELEHGVVGHLLCRVVSILILTSNLDCHSWWIRTLGELALSRVTGVSLAEDGVAVTGNDTAGVEGGPEVVGDGLVAEVVANGLLHLSEPVENLLVGQTVERTGQTVETSSNGKEGGGQSTADQVGGVGRDVTTLVVSVDGEVETEQLDEVGVAAEAELVGEVEGVILVLLNSGDLAALEDVLVDASGNGGQLGNQVHGVLKGVSPVVLLVDTLGVGLGERRGVLEGGNGQGELSHGVKVGRAVVDQLLDELGDVGAGGPLGGQVADLLLGRDLASQEKPEETFGVLLAKGIDCENCRDK